MRIGETMPLRYGEGDATRPESSDPRVLVPVCTDVGAWGAGVVLAVARRWQQHRVTADRLDQGACPGCGLLTARPTERTWTSSRRLHPGRGADARRRGQP